MRRALASCAVALAILAVIAGSLALTSTPASAAKPCRCPLYCNDVICDNGQIYCNSCLAGCAGAKNCHPL